jgi:transposase
VQISRASSLDRFVDISALRDHLRTFYSDIGRPSIDPELMIRMLVIGCCFGTQPERRQTATFFNNPRNPARDRMNSRFHAI